MPTKATSGIPPHRIQRGMGRSPPKREVHAASVPSGQRKPHQARPKRIIESTTKGHYRYQKTNWEERTRFVKGVASSGGRGRNGGTRIRLRYRRTMTWWSPGKNRECLRRDAS